jgi:Ca2+-binding EF-hand superfamily protein
MGSSLKREELVHLMAEFDHDRSGSINIDEFVHILTNNDEFEF